MYNKPSYTQSSIRVNNSGYIAETLEEKIRKMMQNKEQIDGGAELIYQERQDGVQAAYNIRTDRWDVALTGKEAIEKSESAKRQLKIGEKTYDSMTPEQQQKFNKEFPMNKFAKTPGAPSPNTGGAQ